MAQRQIVTLIDDIDGSEAVTSHTLTLDGVTVKIDLSQDNSAALQETLRPYLQAGSRTSGRATGGRASRARGSGDTNEIRAWARENGYQVSDRGRISAEIRQAYQQRAGA